MNNMYLMFCKDLEGNVPKEIQVIPYGYNKTAKGDFLCDEASAEMVMSVTQINDMVIDFEHQTLTGQEAPAAGWIKELINKGKEGIWAVVEWTEKAKQYISNKEYRYVSPVFLVRQSDKRVMRLFNVALTNQPNIDGMVPLINKVGGDPGYTPASLHEAMTWVLGLPIDAPADEIAIALRKASTNKEEEAKNGQEGAEPDSHMILITAIGSEMEEWKALQRLAEVAESVAKGHEKRPSNTKEVRSMKKVLEVLGLAEGATEDAVVAAINTLKQPSQIVASKAVIEALGLKEGAVESEVTGTIMAMKQSHSQTGDLAGKVKELSDKLSARDADDLVTMAMKEGKITAVQKPWAEEYAKKDPEGFKVFVAKAAVVVPMGELGQEGEKGGQRGVVDEATLMVAKMFGNSEADIKKTLAG